MPESTAGVYGRAQADRQGGFALPAAIFALSLMAVMIAGSMFASRQESRISSATKHSALAFYLTERGINETLRTWNPASFASLATFGQVSLSDTTSDGYWDVDVTRLGPRLFFVSSNGHVTRGGVVLSGAEHQQGLVARIDILAIDPPAALITRGEIRVGGTAEIHGEDIVPPGWGGYCSGVTDKPGVLNPDSLDVSTFGAGDITGAPAVQEDPSIADSTFTNFGGLDWSELTALADKTLGGGTFSGIQPSIHPDSTCNTGDADNWGDPTNPGAACGSYFPIVHITGNARMQGGGEGQGILLVDGNLDLRGGFLYHGIIIVQGEYGTQGSGNRVLGGVYAANADVDDQTVVGGSITQTSTCAVSRALLNNANTARPRPLAQRSWVDVTGVSWVN
ncbi:MAG: hypothetical protein ACR2QM_00700 [Longimicrobiales bacterium]